MRNEFSRQQKQQDIVDEQDRANREIEKQNLEQKQKNAMRLGQDMEDAAKFSETALAAVIAASSGLGKC